MGTRYVNKCNDEIPNYIVSKAREKGCINPLYIYNEGKYGGKLPKASIGCTNATRFRNAANVESMKVPVGDGWVAFKSPTGKGSHQNRFIPKSSSEAIAEKHTSILCHIEDIFMNLPLKYKTYLTTHNSVHYKNAEKRTNRTFHHLAMYTTDRPRQDSHVKDPDSIVIDIESGVILYVIEVKWGYLKNSPNTDLNTLFKPKELNEIIRMIKTSKVCRVEGPYIRNGDVVPKNEKEKLPDFTVNSNTKFLVVSDLKGLWESNPAVFNSIKIQYENSRNQFSICDVKENVDTFYSLEAHLRGNPTHALRIGGD